MKSALTASALAGLAFFSLAAPSGAARAAKAAPAAAAPAQPGPADWRTPDPNDVLVIDTNKGRILVELVPEVAPQFVARVRELAHQHFYDGQTFFRVIDDFMDQTGDPKNDGTSGSSQPDVPAEFSFRRGADTPFALAVDHTVDEVGFLKSLPVASQSMMLAPMTKDGMVQAWALYCPGVAGAARAGDPNSANSQFFLMRAHRATLEKRYAGFGRVIAGQEVVNAIKTGEPVPEPQDRMERVRLLADLPPAERPKVRVIDPAGAWFKAAVARQVAARGAEFSACDVEIPAEVK
ncbi:MAG: peptidyl-prolyl cis-trans isomerase, cyclophilin-type [Phenylobacterium sp.]|nr:peptidyl-prolyl cis-trans isomerase, cyclophilin-type [Phenylobacterium sp.]